MSAACLDSCPDGNCQPFEDGGEVPTCNAQLECVLPGAAKTPKELDWVLIASASAAAVVVLTLGLGGVLCRSRYVRRKGASASSAPSASSRKSDVSSGSS